MSTESAAPQSTPPGPEPVTLITGARKGIGRFLAERYCGAGHRVIGVSREGAEFAHARYQHYLGDVSDEGRTQEIFRQIRKNYGRLDHLVNNAGIAAMNHCLTTPGSTVRRVFATNFDGTFLFCREAAKLMIPLRYGRIVNVASVAVPLKLEGESVYCASKAAVIGFSDVLARELAPFGITVNVVGPGPTDTDLLRGVPRAKIEELLARQAMHCMASFEDIAHVIDFFLHAASRLITGQVVYVGGVR